MARLRADNSKIKNGLRYEQAFKDLMTRFEGAWALYRAACERLLTPLGILDRDFEDLINNPQSGKWQEDRLDDSLRQLLGTSYQPYKNSIEALNRKLEKLRTKLELDHQYLVRYLSI